MTTFYTFWCYTTPLLGGLIADQYLGKYKTIVLFAAVYICGLVILFATSVPHSLEHGAGTGGFITAILVIGLGTGGVCTILIP